ncbi:Transcriptional activator protein ExaE [compost metagenome]|uniref:DNA-binding response regulator, NarL/FixJ family, contains REC and HTH domains n=1 Tax=Pseudomonas jinjuensis TaxID=198616 RepID=A0A1H0RDJ8_9PSED|nr:response regulator transcription factor [Pseudomonas jinjuensis]SDP27511.1 DNA-binding response regulator, NarL/FixJ family, contains REC and HTH domains [Pseudomonas jinjuensis]
MKVLLVDDHAVVRLGCAGLLRAALPEVEIAEAASGEEALVQVQACIPGLVLMDIDLPGISGLEATRRLRQRLPQLRVLFFSQHDSLPLVRQSLDAGGSGYVTKSAAPEVLVEAVRRVLAGQPYIEQPLATRLACQRPGDHGSDPRLSGMTPREMEVFIMLAHGVAVRQIAERLCLSGKTVSNHMTLLKNKLGIDSLAGLVHLAIETGVLRVAGDASPPHGV